MPEVPGIREVNPYKPIAINQTADFAKGLNITEKGQALIREVVGLLGSDRAVRITNTPLLRSETGTANGPTGTPAIDSPNSALSREIDLDKLLMEMELANAEEQANMAQERINVQKDTLANTHRERMDKLNKSLEKMDKAARANKFNKIFGWLMAAAAVVIAVAACVATGGVAIGPCIGALLAVGTCILAETGAMDKITEGIAKGLEKLGMSKQAAQIVAQVALAIAITAASLACCGAGAGAALSGTANTAQQIANGIQKAANIAMKVMGLVSIVGNGVGSGLNYAAGKSQAELTEMSKVLAQLRQQMEDSEEELEKILELIQNVFSGIVAILNSETETQKTIAQQMAQMA